MSQLIILRPIGKGKFF